MKAKHLIEEFDRAADLAKAATSQDEVVGIIQQLKALTTRYMVQKYMQDRWVMPVPPIRIDVNSETRWG